MPAEEDFGCGKVIVVHCEVTGLDVNSDELAVVWGP
jgi:hypothetical protein